MPTVILPSTSMLPVGVLDSLESLHRLGFGEVELSYYNIHHEGVEYPAVAGVYRRALIRAAELGIRVRVVHAPWEGYFAALTGFSFDKLVAEWRILLDLYAGYGVEVVAVHPLGQRLVGRGRVWWLNRRLLAELAGYVEQEGLGLVLAVENLVSEEPWRSVEAVAGLAASVGYESVGVCLDTGHYNINGGSLEGVRPVCAHISDNNGEVDEHLPPGAGSIDWLDPGLRTVLASPAYWVVETHCRRGVAKARCVSQAVAAYGAVRGVAGLTGS